LSRIIFDSGISLDGFFAGDNRSPSNPMGGVSGKIHMWMLNQKAFVIVLHPPLFQFKCYPRMRV